jgi:NADH dehydrogenase
MKIFIFGGTGFVGQHVVAALRNHGHELRLLVHSRSPHILDGIDQVEGDITRLESFERAAEGCDAVINLVGIIREFPLRGVTFNKLHVQATAHAVAAAQKAGIRRYLHMSALGTRADAVSQYHVTKFQAEQLVRSSGLDATIFRPSLIYGPQDDFINMLAGQLRLAPIVPVIGSGSYRLQPIHVDDVARCFALALELPETVGECYELCGNDRLPFVTLLDEVASAMGRWKPIKVHFPLLLIKSIIPLMQRLPQFPITMDQLQMLLEESICGGMWKKVFGFEPRSFADGIREYLRP